MYSTDLTKIKLYDFLETLKTVQLLPSHRILLTDIDLNFKKLKDFGINNLAEIQKLLKNKNEHSTISKKLDIKTEYLIILNRMVNSYVVKSISLDKIGIFNVEELTILKNRKLISTQNYYEHFVKKQSINEISKDKLIYALQIIDLLRINGVGIEYAKILYEIGIKSVADYKNTNSQTILQKFKEFNDIKKLTKSNLGINDIDYCRRFCEKLDCEIESM